MSKVQFLEMTMADYLKHPAVSSHQLFNFLDSTKCPRDYKEEPPEVKEHGDHLDWGSAFHLALLEPLKYSKKVIDWKKPEPASTMGKKENKESWLAACAEAEATGKILLAHHSTKVRPGAERIGEAVLEIKAMKAFDRVFGGKGYIEPVIIWVDEQTGIQCKAKIDWLPKQKPFHADLKSATKQSSTPFGWRKHVRGYWYQVQGAHHMAGINAAIKAGVIKDAIPRERFLWVVSTKEGGRRPQAYLASEAMVVGAQYERNLALARLKICMEKDEWPGYEYWSENIMPVPGVIEVNSLGTYLAESIDDSNKAISRVQSENPFPDSAEVLI